MPRPFTQAQHQAITAPGNVLVVAGAGTGKTSTLVGRCLRVLLEERCALQEILMVTFTEAAAAEMRQRIRDALLEQQQAKPEDTHLIEQVALLDTAPISTLHSFCLHLVSEHFHELGIDPQVTVLDPSQTRPLAEETLAAVFQRHYEGQSPQANAVRDLVRRQGQGSDERIRSLVLKIHAYSQSLPDPAGWFEQELVRFRQPEPVLWRQWLVEGFSAWRDLWLPVLKAERPANTNAHQCARWLESIEAKTLPALAEVIAEIRELGQDPHWPRGTKTVYRDPIKRIFDEAEFLHSLQSGTGVATNRGATPAMDPLKQDWDWVRFPMITLLEVAREFTAAFSRAKRDLGGVDFADLEQQALRLLRDPGTGAPSAIAQRWRQQLRYVFVDEYQDINAAQDAILTALSRDGAAGNRFMVGDVKQSIYRFRLANPYIFRDYEERWSRDSSEGQRIPLTDNFRSREALLQFINAFFGAVMRLGIGGVAYDTDAALQFGDRSRRQVLSITGETAAKGQERWRQEELDFNAPKIGRDREPDRGWPDPAANPGYPRVELLLLARSNDEETTASEGDEPSAVFDLTTTEKEARMVASRLRELKDEGHLVWNQEEQRFQRASWRDMVVLLRSPAGKVEAYAKEFHRLDVPLQAARGGFFEALEVMDLLNLLKLLDNPLQDVPLLAVLRSPLVGLSLEELVAVRAHNRERPFWIALQRFHATGPKPQAPIPTSAWSKLDSFLRQFHAWRELVRLTSLSYCLETVLARTHYEALLLAGARGAERVNNVRRLLDLARQYDPYQRQGLFRFLRFVAAQEQAEAPGEFAPLTTEDAVQLMSIHQSKGLEFPMVVVADLGKPFNLAILREDILLDEKYGLCPQVAPPDTETRYPSLPYWLARQRERRELLGEELRLLYVAATRARDTLILSGAASSNLAGAKWEAVASSPLNDQKVLGARSVLDWFGLWLPQATTAEHWRNEREGESPLLRWRIYEEQEAVLAVRPEEETRSPPAAAGILTEEMRHQLEKRVMWQYPFIHATVEPAKTSVSVLQRQTMERDEEAQPIFKSSVRWPRPTVTPSGTRGKLSAAEAGTAHHLFLQWLVLERIDSPAGLKGEADRLQGAGILSAADVAALDFDALNQFWKGELGQRIRAQSHCVHRELQFTARLTTADLAAMETPLALPVDEFVVVQGVVDLAVILESEIWILDFKTDQFPETELEKKSAYYAPQLRLYGTALDRIYRRRVTERWLHFLTLGKTVRS